MWKTAFKNFEIPSNFLKAVFHNFYLVHSCIFEYFVPFNSLRPGGNKKVTHTYICLSMCDLLVTTRH